MYPPKHSYPFTTRKTFAPGRTECCGLLKVIRCWMFLAPPSPTPTPPAHPTVAGKRSTAASSCDLQEPIVTDRRLLHLLRASKLTQSSPFGTVPIFFPIFLSELWMIDRGKAARRILPTSPVSEFVFINILAAICIRRMRICGLSNARLVQSTFVTDCVQFPNSVVAHNAVGASTHTGELHTVALD